MLKHWLAIAAVVALVVAGQLALSKAYNEGVAFQKGIQAQADNLLADLRNAEKERIENDAQKRITVANDSRDRAIAARAGLQKQLASIKQYAEDHTGVITPGGTARDAVVLLADMLGQCAERYQRVAGFADEAHNAGLTCQAQYKSLRDKVK